MDLLTPPRTVGYGNAMFLADLAENTPRTTLRANLDAGSYPDLHKPSVRGWMAMAGRV